MNLPCWKITAYWNRLKTRITLLIGQDSSPTRIKVENVSLQRFQSIWNRFESGISGSKSIRIFIGANHIRSSIFSRSSYKNSRGSYFPDKAPSIQQPNNNYCLQHNQPNTPSYNFNPSRKFNLKSKKVREIDAYARGFFFSIFPNYTSSSTRAKINRPRPG